MAYLLDSVILIDHFNGIEEASAFIIANGKKCLISATTRAEVLTGFEAKSRKKAKVLLEMFTTISITKDEADLAADFRQEHRWRLPDALQAAVAKTHRLKLVTRNTKDFSPKKHSFVVIPYELA